MYKKYFYELRKGDYFIYKNLKCVKVLRVDTIDSFYNAIVIGGDCFYINVMTVIEVER